MDKPNILLVEDQKIIQKSTVFILKKFNCHIDTADNGTQALALAQQNKYHIILLDLGLPDIDGLTVAKRLRQSQQLNQHAMILALTANSGETYLEDCHHAGMNDFLVKPFTLATAEKILAEYVHA